MGVVGMYNPEKRIQLLDNIRLNILLKSGVQNKELARKIASAWLKQ